MKRFLVYGVNGVINTAITYALYLALLPHMDYRIAIAVVYPVGLVTSYVLNGAFAFDAAGYPVRFVVVNIFLFLLNVGCTTLLVELGGLSAAIAQLITILLVYVVGFSLNRQFVFVRDRAQMRSDP